MYIPFGDLMLEIMIVYLEIRLKRCEYVLTQKYREFTLEFCVLLRRLCKMLFSPLSDQVIASVCNPTQLQDIFEVEMMTHVKKVHNRYCFHLFFFLVGDGYFPAFQLWKLKTPIKHVLYIGFVIISFVWLKTEECQSNKKQIENNCFNKEHD